MQDILNEIITHKKGRWHDEEEHPLSMLEQRLSTESVPFYSLKTALEKSSTGIIAEFKRRSPAKGGLIGRRKQQRWFKHELAGAAALSVLTDEPYFGGTLTDLRAATRVFQFR